MINLRPSGSYMWTRCAAQPKFAANSPSEPDSDAAREGTCAAWVAEKVLKGGVASCADMEGKTHANGWLVTAEMVYYVQGYVDLIQSRGGVTTAEQFVRLSDCIAGTFDSSTSLASNGVLCVDDLKYGFRIIEPFELTQLIIYGAAEFIRLNDPRITRIELGIYQPRAWHPEGIHRTWKVTPEELMSLARWVIERGELCQAENPIATPGDHCDYCPARGSCVALAHSIYSGFRRVEDTRQKHMTADEIAKELNFLDTFEKMFKARKTAIEAEAEHRIRAGEYVRGWGMKERHGNRVFTVDGKVAQALTGVSPFNESTCTPAEFERRGANVAIVKKITKTPVIGVKLDRVTDKDFRRAFGAK